MSSPRWLNWSDCLDGGVGEQFDPDSGEWRQCTKEEIKRRFRDGEVTVLIGTDSMSEGLNLQTCKLVVNFDLPWNFARVEQRIGRVDRIGGQPEVTAVNLLYEGTIEEQIYTSLRDQHEWFGDVLGQAAPVLAAAEAFVRDAAMGAASAKEAVGKVGRAIERAGDAPIQLSQLDSVPVYSEPMEPTVDLDGLRAGLLSIGPIRELLSPLEGHDQIWTLRVEDGHGNLRQRRVTFDRICYDNSPVPGVELLSWGSDALEGILRHVGLAG